MIGPTLARTDIIVVIETSKRCQRLQHLDVSHNDVEAVNELNHLIPLRFLQQLVLAGGPIVAREGSFYRARVLRRLQQLTVLDSDVVSAREKVKALVMHGSDVVARQRVFAKHLPGQQFINSLYVPLGMRLLVQYLSPYWLAIFVTACSL